MAQEEGYLGRKTDEPSISSSEATGSNKSMIMPETESHNQRLRAERCPRLFAGIRSSEWLEGPMTSP